MLSASVRRTGIQLSARSARRIGVGLKALPLILLLAACTPAGGDDGDGDGGGGDPPDWAAGGVTFDFSLADQYRNAAEFNFVNADFISSGPDQSHPYVLINVHVAHSSGLTGAGQLVALVDNGIRFSGNSSGVHQEFLGKNRYCNVACSSIPLEDHGTMVAALIAGNRDGVGRYGVAPGADLHFTTYTLTLANIINGTLDARSLGAVAQNNSWGFDIGAEELADYLATHPGATVATALSAIIGYGASEIQEYIDALNAFQNGGVIVWAVSNSDSLSNGSIIASVPYFETSLKDAWIAAVNGYFEVDGSGNVTYAEMLSAPCGYAASFCLAGDGTVWSADATATNGFSAGTGTSFVAPLIAGAVALLAEAFPSLSPEEWTKRLLATADNSWFASQGVPFAGTVDFGGGIEHSYATEWGHGTVDLEAALSPIGTVSILSAGTVTAATRTPLVSGGIAVAGPFGDALSVAFSGRDMAVFDYFNGNFRIDAGELFQARPQSLLRGLVRNVRALPANLLGPGGMNADVGVSLGLTNDLAGTLYGAPNGVNGASVLALAGEAAMVSTAIDVGGFDLSLYGYAGGHRIGGDRGVAGVGINAVIDAWGGALTMGFNQSLEQGALLGLVGNDAFDFGRGSAVSAAHLGYAYPLGGRLSVFGNVEMGVANALGVSGNSLVESIGPISFSGYHFGSTASDVFFGGDRLTLSMTRPMRVDSGSMVIALPVGRTVDGAILTEALSADLAPLGNQRDLGFNYAIALGASRQLSLAATYSLDAGNVLGAAGFALAAGYRAGF